MKPYVFCSLIAVLLLAGAFPGSAAIISVNLHGNANDQQQIDPDETFGISSQGSAVSGWVNLRQTLAANNLAFSDGSASTVNMTGTAPNGWASFNGAYGDTPLLSGIVDYVATASPMSVTLNNLAANFPNGYKIIVYVGGFNLNTGARVTDGTTTFYYQTLDTPAAPVTFVQTTTTSDPGLGNAPFAQYAVFGEPVLLTANSLTLTVKTLYGGGAGLCGFQIIGQTSGDEITRIWTGNQSSVWDTQALNWSSPLFGPTNYMEGDIVIFDDTPAATSPIINLTAARSPSRVTIDSTRNYSFTGSAITGATGLIKRNIGTLTLANANTYEGMTEIGGGVLKIGTSGAIPDGPGKGDVNVGAGATLDLNGISEGINGLSGAGTIDSTAGPATLTVGLDNDDSVFAGTIQGAVSLAKRGTNMLTLTGSSFQSGGTFVEEGTLSLPTASSYVAGGALVISNGATLLLGVTNGMGLFAAGTVSLNGGKALTVDYGDASQTGFVTPIAAAGALNLNGVTQIGIAGSGFAVGTYTLISYASKTGSGSIGAVPAMLPTGMVATIMDTGSAINLVVTFPAVQSLVWTGGTGNWTTNAGVNNWNYGMAEYKEYANGLGDAVQFDTSSSGTVTILHDVRPFSVSVNGNYVVEGPGRITGATGLEKVGSTTLIFSLNNSNSYTGITKVSQGTLQINHPGALGSTMGETVVTNGGSLALSNAITLAGERLVLSGDGVTGNNGALRSIDTNNTVTVVSEVVLAANARIRVDNGRLNLAGPITDRGSNYMLTLHAGGTGTLRVTSASNVVDRVRTYGFNLNGGTIAFGAANAFPHSRVLAGGGYIDLNGFSQLFQGIEPGTDSNNGRITNSSSAPATLTISGTNEVATVVSVAGNLGVVKNGAGRQAFNGANTYSGATTINAGTLRINGDSSGATNSWTVSGGILNGSGVVGGPVSVLAGGALLPGSDNFAIGTLTISNNLSLAGTVIVGLNKSVAPSNDVVNVTGMLMYGGTLTATNLGPIPLAVGDSFTIFPAGGTGSFASIIGDPGVTFSFADGVLTVVSLTGPKLDYVLTSEGVLQFSWTGPFKLQYQTNSLSTGLSTNWEDYPDLSNPVNVTNNVAVPASFFRLHSL